MKDRLKQIRIELELSQQQMAEKLGVELNTYRGYEYKTKNLPDKILDNLVNELNVNLNWLYTGQGCMFNSNCYNTLEKQNNTILIKNLDYFHKRFNSIQLKNGLSDFQLSTMLDIPESRIEKLGIGKVLPTLEELNKIKSKFDVSIDWLLYDETVNNQITNTFDDDDKINLSENEIQILKKFIKKISDDI